MRQAGRKQKSLRIEAATEDEEKEGVFMEQPMFSLTSYHGERKLAWKRICNMNSFQDHVPCVDLPQISSIGAFVHALLSRTCLSVS